MTDEILLTGFGPFGTHPRNVSQEAARALEGFEHQGFRVRALELPVHFEGAVAALEEALAGEEAPAAIVSLGIHGEPGASFRLELAARNERDYPIPDVEGEQVQGQPVVSDGPEVVYSTLPLAAIRSALAEGGLQAELSEDAGTYLCNAVFYWCAHWARARAEEAGLPGSLCPVGFLHVPADPAGLEQVREAAARACQVVAQRLSERRVAAV